MYCKCVKTSYERKIRDTEQAFSIDKYKVFQIDPITNNPRRKKWDILSSSVIQYKIYYCIVMYFYLIFTVNKSLKI